MGYFIEYMLHWMKTCNRFSIQFKLCCLVQIALHSSLSLCKNKNSERGKFYRVCNSNWLLKLVSNIG